LGRRLGKYRIEEVKVKGNVAGEVVRSEPGNQTSVRFRSGAMVKMSELVEDIPQAGAKNQIKLGKRIGTISQIWCFRDTSDVVQTNQQLKIVTD